jgi:ABC-type dipeptide/oligopeptide/nickel transport system permease subunit
MGSSVFPGLTLTIVLLAIYFVGDGLRDAFDPANGRTPARRPRRRMI